MLPLLPIGIALATATVLIKRKIGRNAQKSKQTRLLNFIKSLEIPVDGEGKFNPDSILGDGAPLLFKAMSDPELFTALLEHGANPDICNADGVPAIIKASKSPDSEELVSILLKHGANPNAMDSEGKTAIFYTPSEVILTKLASAGADMNATDIHGQTALFHGVIHRNSTEAFLTLKRLGADVNARDSDGKTILFYTDDVGTVAFLVHHGADIETIDNNGEKCKCYEWYKMYKARMSSEKVIDKKHPANINTNLYKYFSELNMICCTGDLPLPEDKSRLEEYLECLKKIGSINLYINQQERDNPQEVYDISEYDKTVLRNSLEFKNLLPRSAMSVIKEIQAKTKIRIVEEQQEER